MANLIESGWPFFSLLALLKAGGVPSPRAVLVSSHAELQSGQGKHRRRRRDSANRLLGSARASSLGNGSPGQLCSGTEHSGYSVHSAEGCSAARPSVSQVGPPPPESDVVYAPPGWSLKASGKPCPRLRPRPVSGTDAESSHHFLASSWLLSGLSDGLRTAAVAATRAAASEARLFVFQPTLASASESLEPGRCRACAVAT